MKLILLLLAFSCTTQGLDITKEITEYSRVAIAKWISSAFIARLKKEVTSDGFTLSKFSLDTLIPKLDDPAELKSMEIPLPVNSEGFKSSGFISLCTPQVTGLSKLKDDLTTDFAEGMSLKWELKIPSTLRINGPYKLSATVNSRPLFGTEGAQEFQGEGDFLGSVESGFIKLKAIVTVLGGTMGIETLSLDLGFKGLVANFENTAVNEDPTSLDHLAGLFEIFFKTSWTKETKRIINRQIKCSMNSVIGKCTIQNLIEGNLKGCLNFKEKSSCFGKAINYFRFGSDSDSDPLYCHTLDTQSTKTEL